MTATEVVAVPTTLLVDSRNTCLRATWHPSDHVVVLSHWRDGACASSFQLANQDVARLTSFLVDVLGASVSEPSGATSDGRDEPPRDRSPARFARSRTAVSDALGRAQRAVGQP